jgi:hypothetical protein
MTQHPILELRQYTLKDGQRDVLIDLFESEFVESQEAHGYRIVGTFTDLDRPERFVWLRAFKDMQSRAAGLGAFYGGPVWQAHRDAANATMIDSDNVLLLHAPDDGAELDLADRPAKVDQNAAAGLVVATVNYLNGAPNEAAQVFRTDVAPALERGGIQLLGWFVTESEPNNFPRLPVREGETVLVWFARSADEADLAARITEMRAAAAPLKRFLAADTETLRLRPTARSLLR